MQILVGKIQNIKLIIRLIFQLIITGVRKSIPNIEFFPHISHHTKFKTKSFMHCRMKMLQLQDTRELSA